MDMSMGLEGNVKRYIDGRISREAGKFENAIRNLTPLSQLQFEVHVTEHCNLNCRQCAHFSPLAKANLHVKPVV